MRHLPVEGYDVTEITPIGGVIPVSGIIRTPQDKISIRWEIDGTSGSTECEAWRGQHEIDCLVNAGRKVKSVSLA